MHFGKHFCNTKLSGFHKPVEESALITGFFLKNYILRLERHEYGFYFQIHSSHLFKWQGHSMPLYAHLSAPALQH